MTQRSIIILSALLGTACGTTAPSIEGRWASTCLSSPQQDGSTNYFDLDFDIGAERWALDYVVHGDPQCSSRLLTVHIEGPYELGEPSKAVEGAHEGVFRFDSKTMTPHVEGLAAMLNDIQGCGEGTWAAGETKDVFEVGCPAFGQYPKAQCAADHDLVEVKGEAIHFGQRPADNDMCTPEKRPAALNPGGFARKGR